MAKLSDFIEALHNDITLARASSDMQTVELAKIYASNDLLKSLDFSVPRMKIRDLEVEVKCFIKMSDIQTINIPIKLTNEDIVSELKNQFSSSLSNLINDKENLIKSLDIASKETLVYSKRYLNSEQNITKRINKISENFKKNFDKQIIGYSDRAKKEIGIFYGNIDGVLISRLADDIAEQKKSLDFEFNKDKVSNDYQEVNFKFTIIEDDLIWEVDKELAKTK